MTNILSKTSLCLVAFLTLLSFSSNSLAQTYPNDPNYYPPQGNSYPQNGRYPQNGPYYPNQYPNQSYGQPSRTKHILIGTALGALGGGLLGGKKGAVIGAGAGAGVGYVIYKRKINRQNREYVPYYNGR